MTDPTYTHLTLVVDRSGSMEAVQGEANGGIATLLDEQFGHDAGRFTLTVVEFDNEIDTVCRLAAERPGYTLVPRGMTALLDAVGGEIARTGADLAALPDEQRPGAVLFVIVTDGMENASQEYTLEQVRRAIEQQTKAYRWTFQFIGAGEAAWQGHDLGAKVTTFRGSGSTQAAYAMLSQSTKGFRTRRMSAPQPDAEEFSMPEEIDTESR